MARTIPLTFTFMVLICDVYASLQIRHCAVSVSPGISNHLDFGGDTEMFDNGTLKCVLDDHTSTLSCMAMFELVNVTSPDGNFTKSLSVKAQGCWSHHWNDATSCQQDKCVERVSKGRTLAFCCCLSDHCNTNEKIEALPPLPDSEEIPVGGTPPNPLLYIIPFLVVVLFIVITIIVVFYFWRKRVQQKHSREYPDSMTKQEMGLYSDAIPLVNYDDMKLDICLNRGRFGDVYRAKLNDKDVCVKYFHPQQRLLFVNEKDIYSVLDPQFKSIVQCFACDERLLMDGAKQYLLIMEYIPFGSLSSYLKTHSISWKELCQLGYSAASGLGYLHGECFVGGKFKHAIVHRDINSRNILVRNDMTCALADMGFAMKIRGSKIVKNNVEESAENGSLRDVGTVRYMAPEILDCAVNLKDCESSLKQIDVYAFALVVWELLTRCRDIHFEKAETDPKRFMLPYEEELGTHPDFERMRLFVAKEHRRPQFPLNMKKNEATKMLKETIEECWDHDAEARLTALCVAERFKDLEPMMEHKGLHSISKNDTHEKRKRLSSSSTTDMIGAEHQELSPLIEQDTPASENNDTTPLYHDSIKADVNREMERERQLAPRQGRNVVAERNTCHMSDEDMTVMDNKLVSAQEARARQAAEEGRQRRQQEEMNYDPARSSRVSRPPTRNVVLDVRNEVNDKVKENNLNRRRHNSQHNLNESSTSSNGGVGVVVTVPTTERPSRPKSLNLNIKPEEEC